MIRDFSKLLFSGCCKIAVDEALCDVIDRYSVEYLSSCLDYSQVTSLYGCCDDDLGKFVRPEFCKCDIIVHQVGPRGELSICVKTCLSVDDPSVDGFDTDYFYLPDLYTFVQAYMFFLEESGQEGEFVLSYDDICKFSKTYNYTHSEITWMSLLPQLCVALDSSKIYEDVGILKNSSSVACFDDVETASIYFYWKNVAISAYNNEDYFRSALAMYNMWDLLTAFTNYDVSTLLFIDVLNIDPICSNISPEGITDTISNFFKGWVGKTKESFSSIVKKCVDSCLGLVQQWLSESVWKNLSEAIYGFLDSVIDPFHLLDNLFDKLSDIWKKEDEAASLVDKKHVAGDYGLRWGRLVCKFVVVIVTIVLGVLTYANWDNLMAVVGISKSEAMEGPVVPEGTNSFATDFITVLSLALTPLLGSSCKNEQVDLIQLTRDAMSFTNFGRTVGNAFVAALNVLPDCISGILCPLFGDEKQRVAYYTNAMISRSDVILEYSKVSSVYSQQGFKDELADTLRWAQPIMKKFSTNSAMNEFRNRYNMLCRISQQLTVSQTMKTPRNIPFWIHIAARPGVGKSTSCRYLINYILDNFKVGNRSLHGVWYRCPADPFYTAYKGEEIVVWDEFLNEADPKKLAEDMNEMLSICSSTPYFPPLPSVEDGSSVGVKGTPFKPVVVITMNNNLSVNSDKEDIEIALMRRRNMCIVVQPNPTFENKFSFEWNFDTSKPEDRAIVSSGNHLLFEFYNKNCFVIKDPNVETNVMHPSVVSYNNLFHVISDFYNNHVKVNSLFNPNVEELLFDDAKKIRVGNHFVYETTIADPEAGRTFIPGDKVVILKNKKKNDLIPAEVTEVEVTEKDDKKYVTFVDPYTKRQQFVELDSVVGLLGIVKNRSRLDVLVNEPLVDNSNECSQVYFDNKFSARRYLDQDLINQYITSFQKKYSFHKFLSKDVENMRISMSSMFKVKAHDEIYYYFDLSHFGGWGYYLFEHVNEQINFSDLEPVERRLKRVDIVKGWSVNGSNKNEISFKSFGMKLVYDDKSGYVTLWLPREFEPYCKFLPIDAEGDNLLSYVIDAPNTDEENGHKRGVILMNAYQKWILNAISIYYTAKNSVFSSSFRKRPDVCKNIFRDYMSFYMVPALAEDSDMAAIPAFKLYGTLNPKFNICFYKNDVTYDLKMYDVVRIDEDKQEHVLPCIGTKVFSDIDYEDYFNRFSLGLYSNFIKENKLKLEDFYEDFVSDDWIAFFYRFGLSVNSDDLVNGGIDLRATARVLDPANALNIIGIIEYMRRDPEAEDVVEVSEDDDIEEDVELLKKKHLIHSFINDGAIHNVGGIRGIAPKDVSLSADINCECEYGASVYSFKLNKMRLVVISNKSKTDLDDFLGNSFTYLTHEFTIPKEYKPVGSLAWNYKDAFCAFVVEDCMKLDDKNKIILQRICHVQVPKLKFIFHRFFAWFKEYLSDLNINIRSLSIGKLLDTVFGPQFKDLKKVADDEGVSLARVWGEKIGKCVSTASIITSIGYFLWTRNSKKDESAPILPEGDSPPSRQASGRSFELQDIRNEQEKVISGADVRRKLKTLRSIPNAEGYQYVDVFFCGPNFEGRGIAVANNKIITHYHSVANELLAATDNPRVIVTVINSGKKYSGSVDPDSLKMIPNYDICCFEFTCVTWNPIRENLSCFLTKSDFFNLHISGNNRTGFMKVDNYRYNFTYYYSQAKVHYDFTPITDNETRTVYLPEYITYNVNSQNGWCGSAVLTNRTGSTPAIVGMHVAGQSLSTGHVAYATILYREKVEALIGIRNLDETLVQQVSGKISPESKNVMEMKDCPPDWRYFVPFNTKYHLSIVGEDEVFDNPVEPSILSKKDYRAKGVDPFDYGLNQLMNNEQAKINPDILKRAKSELIAKFHKDNAIRMTPRTLTLDEAICGIDGFLKPMNSRSGLGYPSSAYYSSKKKDMFDFASAPIINPKFRVDMEDYIAKWNRGEITDIYVESYLKDELQKLSKIEEVRTRLTFCFDTRFNIMTRMRFGYALGIITNMHNEYGSGINPSSKELDYYIYKYLSEVANGDKKCFIAGDYKAFDIHMQSAFKEAAYDVIYSFLEQFISREEWDRYVYLSSHPWVRVHNKMYKFVSANFSGNIFTTVLNNIVNSLMIRYVYYLEHDKYKYDDVIRGVFCGDDHVLCVDRSKVEFSGKDLARLMPTLNQVYTSDIKDAEIEDYRNFEEISFLGCIPKKIDGLYIGALKKSTLESHINWVRDDEIFDSIVDAFVMYACVHGLEYYQSYCQKIYSSYLRRDKRFYFRPYEATLYMLINNLSGNSLPTIESNVTSTFSKPVEIGVPGETAYINPSQMNNSEDVGAVATNYLWKDDFRWSTTHAKGAVVYNRTLYSLVTSKSTDVQATMFRQFMYFSSDFSIRVMTNGNAFQQGMLRLIYVPYNDSYNFNYADLMNFHGINILPTGSGDICLDIPFTYNTALARCVPKYKADAPPSESVSNVQSLGSIYFVVLSPLAYTSGQDVSMSIYVALKNPNFQIPVPYVVPESSVSQAPNPLPPPLPSQDSNANPVKDNPTTVKTKEEVSKFKLHKRLAYRNKGKRQNKKPVLNSKGRPLGRKRSDVKGDVRKGPKFTKDERRAYAKKMFLKNQYLKREFLRGEGDLTAYASCDKKKFFLKKKKKFSAAWSDVNKILEGSSDKKVEDVVTMLSATMVNGFGLGANFIGPVCDKIESMAHIFLKEGTYEPTPEFIEGVLSVGKLLMFFDKPMNFDLDSFVPKYPSMSNAVTSVPTYSMQLDPSAIQGKGRAILGTIDTNIQSLLSKTHLFQFNWSNTDATLTSKLDFPCNSLLSDVAPSDDRCSVPIFTMNQFKYWSSDIQLKFHFVKTPFHTGRLRVICGYGCYDVSEAQSMRTTSFTTIINISDEDDNKTVVIPYVSMFDMLETAYSNKTGWNHGDTNSFGYVVVEVANVLSTSVSNIKPSIDVLVEASFVNSRVCVPRSICLFDTTPSSVGIKPESAIVGETAIEDDGDSVEVDVHDDDIESHSESEEIAIQAGMAPEFDETNAHQVTTVYEILRRYQLLSENDYTYVVNATKKVGNLFVSTNFNSGLATLFITQTGGLNYRIFIGAGSRLLINYVPRYYGRNSYKYLTNVGNIPAIKPVVGYGVTSSNLHTNHPIERSYMAGNEGWVDVHLPYQSIVDFAVYDSYGELCATVINDDGKLPSYVEVWISAGDDFTIGNFLPPKHYYVTGVSNTTKDSLIIGDVLA